MKALKFVCNNHSNKNNNDQSFSTNEMDKEKIVHVINNFRLVLKHLLNLLIERAQNSPFYEESVSKGMYL